MSHSGFGNVLQHGGFRAFLATQFLGAFNDSVYQTIVALHVGAANPAYVPLVPAVFTLPSLLFSGYAGHLADAVSKRKVLIAVKAFEIAIMIFGLATLRAGWVEGMLGVVFLMGLHAAIFSPAKYGIVPEMVEDRDLSRANALLEMSTFVAIVLGIAGGGVLVALWKAQAWRIGMVTLAIAVTGFAMSLGITRVPPSGAKQRFRWNPFGEIVSSTQHLVDDRALWLTVLGVAWFWFAGVLHQDRPAIFRRRSAEDRRQRRLACCGPSSPSASAWATCWPGGSPATRWNSDWCRSAQSSWACSRWRWWRRAIPSRHPRPRS